MAKDFQVTLLGEGARLCPTWGAPPNLGSEFYRRLFDSAERWHVPGLGTMATDGRRIFIDPDYEAKLTDSQRIAVYRHELHHIARNHAGRMRGRKPMVWNIACDMVINSEDRDAGWDLPADGCFLPLSWPGHPRPSAEEVYDWLLENAEVVEATIAGGFTQDVHEASQEEELKAAAQVAEALGGRKAGTAEEAAAQWAFDALVNHSNLDWKSIVAKLLTSWVRGGSSWQRPNRRFIGQGMYLPSNLRQGMKHLLTCVDVSGSMPQALVQNILADIQQLRRAVEIEELELITFNTRKVEGFKYSLHAPFAPRLRAGGGTSFEAPVWHINKVKPDAAIILTDGEANDPGTPLGIHPSRLIWIIYGTTARVPLPGKVFFAGRG